MVPVMLLVFADPFVATYQRFDGIILPEHIIDIPKSHSTGGGLFGSSKEDPATCNGVKLSSFKYRTKDLQPDNHKELRKNGLSMHLQRVHDFLVGTKSMDDPVYCIEEVCAIYVSLHKYYLCYKKGYGYQLSCHEWEFIETTKV